MLFPDLIRLTTSSFLAYRLRSFLTGLGIAIGITAVILLTSIGEGPHQFVLAEFSQFGTNLIAIQPGKTQTQGGNVGIFGSVRQLSIEDAQALRLLFPALPVHTPWLFAALAELSAISIGLAAGVMPARRAARLDPVEALHAE